MTEEQFSEIIIDLDRLVAYLSSEKDSENAVHVLDKNIAILDDHIDALEREGRNDNIELLKVVHAYYRMREKFFRQKF